MAKKLKIEEIRVKSFTTHISRNLRAGAALSGGVCISLIYCSDWVDCTENCTGVNCDSEYCDSGLPHYCAY